MIDFLLQETSSQLVLENSSGFLILESSFEEPPVVAVLDNYPKWKRPYYGSSTGRRV